MQQQISVITLGVADLARSQRFYSDGFGWTPVFANEEVAFYQMNGLMLGTWLAERLADDARVTAGPPAGFSMAHNVESEGEVEAVMASLAAAGGTITRPADAPPHSGYRGYVCDPDGHLWEIAWNPAWPIDAEGHVTFGL